MLEQPGISDGTAGEEVSTAKIDGERIDLSQNPLPSYTGFVGVGKSFRLRVSSPSRPWVAPIKRPWSSCSVIPMTSRRRPERPSWEYAAAHTS